MGGAAVRLGRAGYRDVSLLFGHASLTTTESTPGQERLVPFPNQICEKEAGPNACIA